MSAYWESFVHFRVCYIIPGMNGVEPTVPAGVVTRTVVVTAGSGIVELTIEPL